jgi:hypothetical protein
MSTTMPGAKVDAMALFGERSIRYDATLLLPVPDKIRDHST